MFDWLRGYKTHLNLSVAIVLDILLVLKGEISLLMGLLIFFIISAIGTTKFAISRIEKS